MTSARRTALWVFTGALAMGGGCSRVPWRLSLDGALKTAVQEDRLVLVYYWRPFNRDCDQMERTVFRSDEVLAQVREMIPVRLDATFARKRGEQLGLRQVPGFVVLAPNGEPLRRRSGPMDMDQFLAFLVMARLSQ
ncbi:MAG: thioredoxin family protein [Planctomycetota bacterium]